MIIALIVLAGFVAFLVLTPVLLIRHWQKEGDRLLAEEAERWRQQRFVKSQFPILVHPTKQTGFVYNATDAKWEVERKGKDYPSSLYVAGSFGAALGALTGIALWNRWRW